MKILLTIIILMGILLCPLHTCAAPLRDQCSSPESTDLRETYNLINSSAGLTGTFSPPLDDLSALSISDYQQPGELIYAVDNVDHIRVSLYRFFASFAVRYSDGSLVYNVVPEGLSNSELLPLWIDRASSKVYCRSNNQYYLLYCEKGYQYKFSDEPVDPGAALDRYGLTIQQSFDGASFEPVEVEMTDVDQYYSGMGPVFFNEIFEATLSPECRYVKVMVEQYSKIATDSEGVSSDLNVTLRDAAMVADVYCTGPKSTGSYGSGADLPTGILVEGEKEDSSKSSSSSSSSNTSTKSSSAGSETNIERSSTTTSTTTTSDSNNSSTTTSYTTNQYYFILSDPEDEMFQQVLEQMGFGDPSGEEGGSGADSETSPQENVNVSVSGDLASSASSDASSVVSATQTASLSQQPIYTEANPSDSSSNDILLYYIIFGISVLIVLRILSIIRTPDRGSSSRQDNDL